VNVAILVGGVPRKAGMSRGELIAINSCVCCCFLTFPALLIDLSWRCSGIVHELESTSVVLGESHDLVPAPVHQPLGLTGA